MSYAPNQLNNITNNTIISSSKQWRKPDLLARSAAREIDLQQKLKISSSQSSSQSSQPAAGLKEKENGVSNSQNKNELKRSTSTTSLSSSQGTTETTNKKKQFATFKFYLDNLDASDQAKIERGIKLLGASQEKFFSNKCTHLITIKNIPLQENMLPSSQNGDTNTAASTRQTRKTTSKNTYKDAIVQNALSWGITLWSSEVMLKTIDYFVKQSPSKFSRQQTQQQPEKRVLGQVLQEEKLFGPSTGANSESQAKRPHFVPFTGHYLIIEDASQVHRPVVSKEYTKAIVAKSRDYPWPFFKTTAPLRSPFGKRAPPPQHNHDVAAVKNEESKENTNNKNDENGNGDSQQPLKQQLDALLISSNTKATTPPATPISTPPIATATTPAAVAGILPLTATSTPLASFSNALATPPVTPGGTTMSNAAAGIANPDSYSLRASGFQPSATNNIQSASTRSVSTSVSTMQNDHKRLPPGESVNRLDKRMVENVPLQQKSHNEHQKLQKQALQNTAERAAANKDERARKEKERKKDMRYCENCNCQFENLEEHLDDQTHQTFIRDQNNFRELDSLLEKTHRTYKEPLPDRFKTLIDPSIDGKYVRFVSDKSSHDTSAPQKRSRSATASSTLSSSASAAAASIATAVAPNKLSTTLMQTKQSTATVAKEAPKGKEEAKDESWGKYHGVFL